MGELLLRIRHRAGQTRDPIRHAFSPPAIVHQRASCQLEDLFGGGPGRVADQQTARRQMSFLVPPMRRIQTSRSQEIVGQRGQRWGREERRDLSIQRLLILLDTPEIIAALPTNLSRQPALGESAQRYGK